MIFYKFLYISDTSAEFVSFSNWFTTPKLNQLAAVDRDPPLSAASY